MHCCVCQANSNNIERFEVRSNVRAFASECFAVWRCSNCQCIHACDDVDLEHYYADYPFHHLEASKVDWMLRAMYRNQARRLMRTGVRRDNAILDFGCGAGLFISALKRLRFLDVSGFDQYSEQYTDATVLQRRYDCVITQDVIEHVDEPLSLVKTLHGLTRPGGVILIGTPNAEDIDLKRPETRIHSLHQPYHRHVLGKTALCNLGRDLGWELVHCYDEMYSNTLVPFVNAAFLKHYFSCFDNNADLAIEPVRLNSWRLYTPRTLFLAFFGYFFPPKYDVMAVFRRPE